MSSISAGTWIGAYENQDRLCTVELEVSDDDTFVLRRSEHAEVHGRFLADDRETIVQESPPIILTFDCGRMLLSDDDVGTVVLKKRHKPSSEPSHTYEQLTEESRTGFQLASQVTQHTNHFFIQPWHMFGGWMLSIAQRSRWPFVNLSMPDVCEAIYSFHPKGEERAWCGKIAQSDECRDLVQSVLIRTYQEERSSVTLEFFLLEMLDRQFIETDKMLTHLGIDHARLKAYLDQ